MGSTTGQGYAEKADSWCSCHLSASSNSRKIVSAVWSASARGATSNTANCSVVKPKDGDNSDIMLSETSTPVEHDTKVGRNHRSVGLLDSLGRGSEVSSQRLGGDGLETRHRTRELVVHLRQRHVAVDHPLQPVVYVHDFIAHEAVGVLVPVMELAWAT